MSFLDPNACRAGLVSVIEGVSGVGRVYPYRRIVRNEAEVQALFVANGKINAWMVSFAINGAAKSDRKMGFAGIGVPGGGEILTTFTFQIEGYYGIDDANDSEETFANLAWSIAQTINSYGLLNIPAVVVQGACDIVMCTYATLAAKFLTHYARLTIDFEGRTQ